MSRQGNYLDNAPVESFFHLLNTELLDSFEPCRTLTELRDLVRNYIHFFNYDRVSLTIKGITPVKYRDYTLANLVFNFV